MNNIHAQWQALCRQFNIPLSAQPSAAPLAPESQLVLYQPAPDIICYRCDYRQLPLKDGGVDAICTDIPWAGDWLPNVEEFAEWCAAKLKRGGIMATWYGTWGLDRLMERLGRHLHYQWMFISPSFGGTQFKTRFVQARYTPCLMYSNVPNVRLYRAIDDWCPSSRREKGLHEHQRSLPPVQFIVEAVAEPGALVVDPCSGSFTTAQACYNSGRRFIGSDNRPNCLDVARQRFEAFTAPNNNHYRLSY